MENITKLIVEYIVAGLLILLAILLLGFSFFPADMQAIITQITQITLIAENEAILVTLLTVIAYSLGVLAEGIGRDLFEWLLNRVKQQRIKPYFIKNKALLKNSHIFMPFEKQPIEQIKSTDLMGCFGQMRFYILNHSVTLYEDVQSHINRFRLIRMLFLVELILILAIIPQFSRSFSLSLFVLVFLLIFMVANIRAIWSRFNRYCRSIERAFLILLQVKLEEQPKEAKSKDMLY